MITDNTQPVRRSIILELTAVTALVLVAAHILFRMRANAVIGGALSAIVAVLFLYVPIIALWVKKRPIDFLDRGLRSYLRSSLTFVVASALIFPPFMLGSHGWQSIVLGHHSFNAAPPPGLSDAVLFQILLIALPEEFYFRGYFQSAINTVFTKKRRFLGADLGMGWVITAAVFAFAHTVIHYEWWHFAIFFPALAFGYLRERTGAITASVLFHASSNLLMDWVARSYS